MKHQCLCSSEIMVQHFKQLGGDSKNYLDIYNQLHYVDDKIDQSRVHGKRKIGRWSLPENLIIECQAEKFKIDDLSKEKKLCLMENLMS